MDTNPDVAVALIALSASDFSQSAIKALFRACIAVAGIEWETPRSLNLFDELWISDSVMAAIEALQDAHEANLDTVLARRHLLATVEAQIREPE